MTSLVVVISAFDRCVKPPCKHILLNLTVPLAGNKLLEPLGKASKLGSRKAGNHGLNFFNAHDQMIRLELAPRKKKLQNSVAATTACRHQVGLRWLNH